MLYWSLPRNREEMERWILGQDSIAARAADASKRPGDAIPTFCWRSKAFAQSTWKQRAIEHAATLDEHDLRRVPFVNSRDVRGVSEGGATPRPIEHAFAPGEQRFERAEQDLRRAEQSFGRGEQRFWSCEQSLEKGEQRFRLREQSIGLGAHAVWLRKDEQ